MSKRYLLQRAQVRFRELQRRSIRFFGGLSNRDFEYDFAYRNVVGENVSVLEIGGADSLLPLQFANRGFQVTVFDYRDYQEKHPNLYGIQGDFLENSLPNSYFDYVVMISTIEHIGFGSYGAPLHENGDLSAIAEARRVLKPEGRIVLTFPFASKEHHVVGFERWYDIERVHRLFDGMFVLAEEYYIPHTFFMGRIVKWIPASLEQITSVADAKMMFGYQCQACYVVSPQPRAFFPKG